MDEQKIRAAGLRAAVALVTAVGVEKTSAEEVFESVFSVSDVLVDYMRTGRNPYRAKAEIIEDAASVTIEPDADFRRRIQAAAGPATIHQQRIAADTGSTLDEVGGFYGLRRKGV